MDDGCGTTGEASLREEQPKEITNGIFAITLK